MKTTLIAALCVLIATSTACHAQDGFRPGVIDFNRSLDQMRTDLGPLCDSITERRINPPKIPGTKESHIQIDCMGFSFGGQKRKVEFSFSDGRFSLVWILTDASEEEPLRTTMEALMGAPSHVTDGFIAFAAHHAALRRDIPEVLFYAPEVADAFTAWFDQQAKAGQ